MERNKSSGDQGVQPVINRNLVQACQRVSNSWFPVNEDLLKKIKRGLHEGAYDLGVDFLIGEIKTDIALFTFCLKEVRKHLQKKGVELPSELAPVDMLRWAGIDVLREILDVEPEEISPHSLSEMNKAQMNRFQETIIGASTAETLAQKIAIDPDLGFSTEVLRQLGLTLIAWNYPKVYERVTSSIKDGNDLDRELTRVLGFSPKLLGIAMARQWDLSPELRVAIGDSEATRSVSHERLADIRNTAGTLGKICEIGEALARANNPEQYPSARADWKSAQSEIQEILGQEGLSIIQEKVKENCSSYLDAAPEAFQAVLEVHREPNFAVGTETSSYATNKYVKHCPESVQTMLQHFYEELHPGQISKDQIRFLAKEIMPAAGFSHGCIFLLEPERMRLVPRLTVGDIGLGTYRERSALSMSTGSEDPIVAAYNCNTPIIENEGGFAKYGDSCIACVLGRSQRVGVLYLEPSEALLYDQSVSALMVFKALCQALIDCLRIA